MISFLLPLSSSPVGKNRQDWAGLPLGGIATEINRRKTGLLRTKPEEPIYFIKSSGEVTVDRSLKSGKTGKKSD
jgi:hypothetical protein